MTSTKLTVLAAALLLSSCVAPTPRGDVSFFWSFAGEQSCARARVWEVDVTLVDADDSVVLAETVLCEGDGLLYEDLLEGEYTVFLDAFDRRGNQLFEGESSFFLEGGALNDLGDVELLRAGQASLGDLAFFWTFDGEPDCATAGVNEVDVEVIDVNNGESLLVETAVCLSGGLFLLDIPPGTAELYLDAYDAQDRRLYEARVPTSVTAGAVTDLGTIDLAPIP